MLSTYKQAQSIAPEDEDAFGFYAAVTIGAIVTHHREEEEAYCKPSFPLAGYLFKPG